MFTKFNILFIILLFSFKIFRWKLRSILYFDKPISQVDSTSDTDWLTIPFNSLYDFSMTFRIVTAITLSQRLSAEKCHIEMYTAPTLINRISRAFWIFWIEHSIERFGLIGWNHVRVLMIIIYYCYSVASHEMNALLTTTLSTSDWLIYANVILQ